MINQAPRAATKPAVLRVVSDNITNGDPYDPKTSEACEDYVFEVVKTYIARSRVQ